VPLDVESFGDFGTSGGGTATVGELEGTFFFLPPCPPISLTEKNEEV